MKHIKKRISKTIDEMMLFFFSIGCQNINIQFDKVENGYRITLKGPFDPQKSESIKTLDKYLNAPKDASILECFWELAGESDMNTDSELYLVGQMIDSADIQTQGNYLTVVLNKQFD